MNIISYIFYFVKLIMTIGDTNMRSRNNYGTENLIGKNVERIRKGLNVTQKEMIELLAKSGYPISQSNYSKLEAQTRLATDK